MKDLLLYLHIVKEPWFWNCMLAIAVIVLSLFYDHILYLRLKRLWSKYQEHHLAAHICMRESGIFTKYWVRTFVKGAERWF